MLPASSIDALCRSNDVVAFVEVLAVEGPPRYAAAPDAVVFTNYWTCRVSTPVLPATMKTNSLLTFVTRMVGKNQGDFSMWNHLGKTNESVAVFLRRVGGSGCLLEDQHMPLIVLPKAYVLKLPPDGTSSPVDRLLAILLDWARRPGGSKRVAIKRLWWSPVFQKRLLIPRVREDFVDLLISLARASGDSLTIDEAFRVLGRMNEPSVLDVALSHGLKEKRRSIPRHKAAMWTRSLLFATDDQDVQQEGMKVLRELEEKSADEETRRYARISQETFAKEKKRRAFLDKLLEKRRKEYEKEGAPATSP